MKIQKLTFNYAPSGVHFDTLDERSYIVAPMVMITEGVHEGSRGPVYYPPEAIQNSVPAWNHKPIVVYHPQDGQGNGISASDPVVINSQRIGIILNAKADSDPMKLRAEAWLDVEKTKKVDNRIIESIEQNQMVEVSTGLYIDAEDSEGEWNGESYKLIAQNHRPDHLAILPDKVGACSVADGAGLLQLNQSLGNISDKQMSRVAFVLEQMGLTTQERSFSNISDSLYSLLQSIDPDAWVVDIFESFFVYSIDGRMLKQDYLANDTDTKIVGEPVEVVRVSEYRTLDGMVLGNSLFATNSVSQKQEKAMAKKDLISNLITGGHFTEEEGKSLESLDESMLKTLEEKFKDKAVGNKEKEKAGEDDPEESDASPVKKKKKVVPTANQKKKVTLNEYIKNAPPEIGEVLQQGMSMIGNQRAAFIKTILNNERNQFTEDQLKSMDTNLLQNLAAMCPVEEKKTLESMYNFSGAATPVDNVSDDEEEPLGLPTLFPADGAKEAS